MKKGIMFGLVCVLAVLFSGLAYADPVLTAITDKTVDEGSTLSFDIASSAPDNGSTVFSLVSGPSGAAVTGVNDTTATFTYTPGDVTNSSEAYTVVVQAEDDNSSDSTSFVVTVNNVETNPQKLEIVDLDIKVGGETDKNVDNGSSIGEDAKPGDTVSFSIEIKNIYDDDIDEEDIEIKDIEVDVTIFDIDDDDDLEEDADEFDLDAGDKETVDVDFEIPWEVDEGDYEVEIKVKGEDDEGDFDHEIVWTLTLTVDKEKHEIIIKDSTLSPSVVKCTRDASLDVRILNIGSKDEDEVVLEVTNTDLGINIRETDLELDEGTDDNDYSKNIFIDANGLKAGNYPITVKAYYDTSDLSDTETVTLTVQDCDDDVDDDDEEEDDADDEEEEDDGDDDTEVVIIPPSTTQPTVPVTAQPVAPTTVSIRDSSTYTAILIILIVIIVILLVFAIVSIMRRK
ncbi:hypothetical protein ACFLZX_01095 [Nanoarchaeota archaeon]